MSNDELNSQEWIEERQEYYKNREAAIEIDLRQSEFTKEIAKEDEKDHHTFSVPSPMGNQSQKQKPLSAMKKVQAAQKKALAEAQLKREIDAAAAARLLEEKTRELYSIEGEAAKKQFAEAVQIETDRKKVEAYRREQSMMSSNRRPDGRDIPIDEKPGFNRRELEAIESMNQTLSIEHLDMKWHYERKGQAETFTHQQTGKPLVQIKKVYPHKSFDEPNNAYVETGGQNPKKKGPLALEDAFQIARIAAKEDPKRARDSGSEKGKLEKKPSKESDIASRRIKMLKGKVSKSFNRSKGSDRGD